jgi:hypothetical protein
MHVIGVIQRVSAISRLIFYRIKQTAALLLTQERRHKHIISQGRPTPITAI